MARSTEGDEARSFLQRLRERADRAALGLGDPAVARTRGITQAEAAELISDAVAPEHVSDRWFRKLEALDAPWTQQIADAYAALLQLHDSELDVFYRIASCQPPADTLDGDLVAADVEFLNNTLSAPSYINDPYWDMRARNRAMASLVPRFRPGINIFEYVLLDPEARQILVDWETWARSMAMQFRSTMLKSVGLHRSGLASIAERCKQDAQVGPLWAEDLQPRLSPNGDVRMIRPPDPSRPSGLGEPVRVWLYATSPASKPRWRYMSLIPLDPLPPLPEPAGDDDGIRWFQRPALLLPHGPLQPGGPDADPAADAPDAGASAP